MPSAKKKTSVKNLRRRMKNNKKIKKKAEEDEKIQSFEAFQKKLQEEREEDARRRDIHDPMDDEKLVKELMEEAEKEKKNRMNIANNGGRDRPVELFRNDISPPSLASNTCNMCNLPFIFFLISPTLFCNFTSFFPVTLL